MLLGPSPVAGCDAGKPFRPIACKPDERERVGEGAGAGQAKAVSASQSSSAISASSMARISYAFSSA